MKTAILCFLVCVFCTGQECDQKKATECLTPKMDSVNSAKRSGNITAQCAVTTDIILCLQVIPNCVNKTAVKIALGTLKDLGCPGFGVKSCVPSLILVNILALMVTSTHVTR
ncbi:uncharacterized protein LOC121372009 [Gigantopelta aegis]|uniref:uncharacterized protein LOC121372009 n=1 Tax=Gigantopelta aegis TaxID=1735272 RepID=UPI001B88CE8E|nr:uncharacterized protein LOC121372009 [Gigantopelta aegis]